MLCRFVHRLVKDDASERAVVISTIMDVDDLTNSSSCLHANSEQKAVSSSPRRRRRTKMRVSLLLSDQAPGERYASYHTLGQFHNHQN